MNDNNFLPHSLINQLKNFPSKYIEDNYLEGILFKYHPEIIPHEKQQNYSLVWKSRWNKNNDLIIELQNLGIDFTKKNISIILIKGMALLHDLYSDLGSRNMSDIDLLINQENLQQIKIILTKHQYKIIDENKWKGNNHKITFEKTINNINVVLEFHTKLFYHVNDPNYQAQDWHYLPYKTLPIELTFIHLVGHYAFQHTFIKFLWAIDIYCFIKKHENEMDWNLCYNLTKHYHFIHSMHFIFYILEEYFNYSISNKIKKIFLYSPRISYEKLIPLPFLLENNQFSFRYFLLKHLTKDSFVEALKYDLGWLTKK